MKLYCVQCSTEVPAEKVTGEQVYPHRPDLYQLVFYKCPVCENFVGTHKATNEPLGCIPSKQLKQQRMMIHRVLDTLWKERIISRRKLYKQISSKLGYEYHTGNIKSIDEAQQVLSIVQDIRSQLLYKENTNV